jgi:hypothetical protein
MTPVEARLTHIGGPTVANAPEDLRRRIRWLPIGDEAPIGRFSPL